MSAPFVAPRQIVRLLSDWGEGLPENIGRQGMPKAGALIRLDERPRYPGTPLLARSGMDGHGFARKPEDLHYEVNPALTWRDFDTLLAFYLRGGAPLPNLGAIDVADGLRYIAASGGLGVWPTIATVKVPGDKSNWGTWARVFLGYTQGGKLDGTGCLIAYQRKGDTSPHGPIWRFKLCDHSVVTGSGARPQRGWHPARCSRCGLDLTVDSSD